jgi:hypothetical protein
VLPQKKTVFRDKKIIGAKRIGVYDSAGGEGD